MKIVIVEPHPDDAMLNLHGSIRAMLSEGHEIHLVSMVAQREDPRERLEELYGAGFSQFSHGFKDINWTLKGRAAYKEKYGDDWANKLETIWSVQEGMSLRQSVADVLETFEDDQIDIWLLPVGQIHPMHAVVRREFGRQLAGQECLFYREFPYWTRVRGMTFDKISEAMGLEEASMMSLTDDELEDKYRSLKSMYPLGTLYMIDMPKNKELLREELVYTCRTTDI